jgi:hypothetical protein
VTAAELVATHESGSAAPARLSPRRAAVIAALARCGDCGEVRRPDEPMLIHIPGCSHSAHVGYPGLAAGRCRIFPAVTASPPYA